MQSLYTCRVANHWSLGGTECPGRKPESVEVISWNAATTTLRARSGDASRRGRPRPQLGNSKTHAYLLASCARHMISCLVFGLVGRCVRGVGWGAVHYLLSIEFTVWGHSLDNCLLLGEPAIAITLIGHCVVAIGPAGAPLVVATTNRKEKLSLTSKGCAVLIGMFDTIPLACFTFALPFAFRFVFPPTKCHTVSPLRVSARATSNLIPAATWCWIVGGLSV